MKWFVLVVGVLLIGCNNETSVQAEQPKLPAKYQVVYQQRIEIDGSRRWLGEIRNTETHEEFLVIQGSEGYPVSIVKR